MKTYIDPITHEPVVPELYTVHHAISDAALTHGKRNRNLSQDTKKVAHTVKLDPDVATRTLSILHQNGCSLSGFLRQCCEGLVKDYSGK